MSTNFKVGEVYECDCMTRAYIVSGTLDEGESKTLLALMPGVIGTIMRHGTRRFGPYYDRKLIERREPMLILDYFNLVDISMRQCQVLAQKLDLPDPNESPLEVANREEQQSNGRLVWVKVLIKDMVVWHRVVVCEDRDERQSRVAYRNILTGDIVWCRY